MKLETEIKSIKKTTLVNTSQDECHGKRKIWLLRLAREWNSSKNLVPFSLPEKKMCSVSVVGGIEEEVDISSQNA